MTDANIAMHDRTVQSLDNLVNAHATTGSQNALLNDVWNSGDHKMTNNVLRDLGRLNQADLNNAVASSDNSDQVAPDSSSMYDYAGSNTISAHELEAIVKTGNERKLEEALHSGLLNLIDETKAMPVLRKLAALNAADRDENPDLPEFYIEPLDNFHSEMLFIKHGKVIIGEDVYFQ